MDRTTPQATRRRRSIILALLPLVFATLSAHGQNARTAVLDADAAASVALVRVMARGHALQSQNTAMAAAGIGAMPAAAGPGQLPVVMRSTALRQLVLVPDNVVTCGSQLSIGTVQPSRPIMGDVNLQVVVTGDIIQVADSACR